MHSLYETLRKLLIKEQLAAPTKTKITAQVAGIDVNSDQLHMDDGRVFSITEYMDPYGKVCEPEDACAVVAMTDDSRIRVEFYNARYTRH